MPRAFVISPVYKKSCKSLVPVDVNTRSSEISVWFLIINLVKTVSLPKRCPVCPSSSVTVCSKVWGLENVVETTLDTACSSFPMNWVLLFYVPNPCSIVIVVDKLDQDAADASESQLCYNRTVTCYMDCYMDLNMIFIKQMFQFLKTSASQSLNKWTTMFLRHVFNSLCLSGHLSPCLPAHHRNYVSLSELSNIKAASFFHSVWLQFKSFQVFVSLHPSDNSLSVSWSLNRGMHVTSVWSIRVGLSHYAQSSTVL